VFSIFRVKLWALGIAFILGAQAFTASAQAIKVGIVGPFSGLAGHFGPAFRNGVEAYVAAQGGQLAGKQIEFIYRDTGGPNPAGTKALVQELIVKDKIDYLGGFIFTPNAYAVAPLIQESGTPTVLFVAATSNILEKSDYFVRTSYTLWQLAVPLAKWAAQQNLKKAVTAVADFAPGIDAETAFKAAYTKDGGTVIESIRMPMGTTDFSPFMQRIKASGAQVLYTFLPGGPVNISFVKAYHENGLMKAGIQMLGTDETNEFDLQKFGDAGLGIVTSLHYSAVHDSDQNRKFIAALKARSADAVVSNIAVGAWDGMYVIHKMIEATGGKRDGAKAMAAAKTLQWESPRGPVRIDPRTRHIVQNVYLRKVERVNGELVNKEILNFGPQPDWGMEK
jgi:branched-chain amino acid transport system substrate-binding protein